MVVGHRCGAGCSADAHGGSQGQNKGELGSNRDADHDLIISFRNEWWTAAQGEVVGKRLEMAFTTSSGRSTWML